MNVKNKDYIHLSARVESDIYNRVKRIAKHNDLDLNKLIRKLLKEYISKNSNLDLL